MSKKNMGGLVYSTDPNFCPNSPTNDTIETLPPEKQRLRLRYAEGRRLHSLPDSSGVVTTSRLWLLS